LAVVAGSAGLGILLLAGPVKDLVVEQRWVMYSLFIGLTLGGVPVVWRLARPWSTRVGWGALGGFVAMAALALAQSAGTGSALSGSNFAVLFVAGLAGASAMILPGVSGGYLLLVLGQYVVILGGIDRVKEALSARDLGAMMEPAVSIVLPVGLGVVVGIVLVSNLLRWLLLRHEKPTLGALLGLLVGAVVGLWPFRRAVEPVIGETVVKGQTLTAAMLATLEVEDLPTEAFDPTRAQVFSAVGLVLAGFLATALIARLGRDAD
jgi:putative membrane protein